MNEINETAETIIQQLGGLALFRLLLGTRKLLFNDKGIDFDIQGCSKINRIRIEYNEGIDLYWIKFFRYIATRASLNLVAEYEGIYADQLNDLIESQTGLFFRPFRIQRA